MKRIITTLFIIISVLTSCNTSTSPEKQKELELKEKELNLKEKELQLKEQSISSNNRQESSTENSKNKKINELSDIENLIGYWFIPHGASLNIKFKRDGNFEFNDYNSTTETEELLTGTYELKNGTLTLMYDDRPKQDFKFYKGKDGDENFYIKKSGYYFVKGENRN